VHVYKHLFNIILLHTYAHCTEVLTNQHRGYEVKVDIMQLE